MADLLRRGPIDTTVHRSHDDDDGTGNGADGTVETALASAIAGKVLAAGGTYFIRVRAFSATEIIDPYKLSVVVTNTAGDGGNGKRTTPRATANPILPGATSNVQRSDGCQARDVRLLLDALAAATLSLFPADSFFDPGA